MATMTETVHKQSIFYINAPVGAIPPVKGDATISVSHIVDAIPSLPLFLAIFCCFMNIVLPGSGTVLSGVFLQFTNSQCRIKTGKNPKHTALIINLIVALGQVGATILLLFVGWIWSVVWGVLLIKYAALNSALMFLFYGRMTTSKFVSVQYKTKEVPLKQVIVKT